MRVNKTVSALVAGCAVVVMSAVSGLTAQTPQEHEHTTADEATPPSGMEAKCQAMMAEKETMMADMTVADQRLDDLVVTMNTASGVDKMAATAAVVSEMVTQRRTMRDGMMKMQEDMMGHMMEHMQAGAASMAMCPMMEQMGGMKP
jgi:hypothetical protein